MADEKPVILSTVETKIPESAVKAAPGDSEAGASQSTRRMTYIVKGRGGRKLTKNEDPEVRDRYTGIRYEVCLFELWNDDDRKAYEAKMTEVGTDPFASQYFHERIYVPEKKSWKVLLEIAHYVQVVE